MLAVEDSTGNRVESVLLRSINPASIKINSHCNSAFVHCPGDEEIELSVMTRPAVKLLYPPLDGIETQT